MSSSLWPPWTVACQVPLSMGFSGQEFWSRLPCPSPGDLPDPGDWTCVSHFFWVGKWVLCHQRHHWIWFSVGSCWLLNPAWRIIWYLVFQIQLKRLFSCSISGSHDMSCAEFMIIIVQHLWIIFSSYGSLLLVLPVYFTRKWILFIIHLC